MANWNNLVAIRVRKMFFPEQTTETKSLNDIYLLKTFFNP